MSEFHALEPEANYICSATYKRRERGVPVWRLQEIKCSRRATHFQFTNGGTQIVRVCKIHCGVTSNGRFRNVVAEELSPFELKVYISTLRTYIGNCADNEYRWEQERLNAIERREAAKAIQAGGQS